MTVKFKPNPRFKADLARSVDTRNALARIAQRVADRAEPIGQQVADSYETEVDIEGDKVRVVANTDGINAASWIEVGTGPPTPTPAHAPLRKAVQAEGLKLK